MQTFLPYGSFFLSAVVLDRQRLGKQRVETKQILMCLRGEGSLAWARHPAVRMWKGWEGALARYGMEICEEWRLRGYKDSLFPWFEALVDWNAEMPAWLGREDFHAAHRAALLRKAPEWYGGFGWEVDRELPYVWPEGKGGGG